MVEQHDGPAGYSTLHDDEVEHLNNVKKSRVSKLSTKKKHFICWWHDLSHNIAAKTTASEPINHAMTNVDNAGETDRNSAVMRKLRPIRQIDSAPAHVVIEKDTQSCAALNG